MKKNTFTVDGRVHREHAKLLEKLATAEARVKALEKQRNIAVDALDRARAAKRHPLPQPLQRRARCRGDLVRVIFGDTHGCKIDLPAFSALLGDMKRFDPHHVVLGGDMLNCGGFLAQHHTLGYVAETAETYEQDVAAANTQIDAIQAAAPRAQFDYLEGNHEDRVERWAVTQALKNQRDADFLRRLVSPETLLDLKRRGIHYYRRSECHDDLTIPGWIRRGKVYFTHEISHARNAAAAAVASTGGNIVFFHTHRQDFSPLVLPAVGLVAAWNPGCLCQRQPLWRHTRPTHWTNGYAVQLVSPSGNFLHINVLIENGVSLVGNLLK